MTRSSWPSPSRSPARMSDPAPFVGSLAAVVVEARSPAVEGRHAAGGALSRPVPPVGSGLGAAVPVVDLVWPVAPVLPGGAGGLSSGLPPQPSDIASSG